MFLFPLSLSIQWIEGSPRGFSGSPRRSLSLEKPEVHARPSEGARTQTVGQLGLTAARRSAGEEVGHHLSFALHRDHASVLQRVVVGAQDLLQVRRHLGEDEEESSQSADELIYYVICLLVLPDGVSRFAVGQ